MKQKSIKVNAVYSGLKVLLNIIFPFITFPYASRILQVESIGKVNYGTSVINYFALIAALGISTYAVREGAKIRDDKKQFETFTKEVFTTNLITTVIAYVLLLAMLAFVPKFHDYRVLILIQSLSIVFATIGVEWINTIYEDYLYILIRSFAVQLLALAGLFLFVKDSGDYYIYAALTVISNGLISILNILHVKQYCRIGITLKMRFGQHIKPMLVFFANSLAITVYMSADTIMLGWMLGDYYTGIYSTAVKIYTIVKTMLNSIYSVAIPRLAFFAASGKREDYKETLTRILSYLMLLIFPGALLLGVFSENIVVIISGEAYAAAAPTMQILSVALIFAVLSGVLVTCLNVTLNREKISLKGTIYSALINIVLNLFFIPMMQHNGAAITTVIAEFFVAIYCVLTFRGIQEYIDVKEIGKQALTSIAGCCFIFAACFGVRRAVDNRVWETALAGLASGIVYGAFLLIIRNKYFCTVLSGIKMKFR